MRDVVVDLVSSEWTSAARVYARGGAFFEGQFYDSGSLATLVEKRLSGQDFLEIVASLNGYYSIIAEDGETTYAAVDQIQSAPLFWTTNGTTVTISDDCHSLHETGSFTGKNTMAVADYALTGYATGCDTLYNGLYQLQAGEVLVVEGDDWDRVSHTNYLPLTDITTSDDVTDRIDEMTINVFERLIEYADGRPIVVHLSGGYDSKLIAGMLVRLGYENLYTLTYSYYPLDEKTIGQKTAEILGTDHIEIGQSKDEVYDWYHSDERSRVERYSGYLHAYPSINTALIWKKAREQGRVPQDSVFVTGDKASSTGGHIPKGLYKGRSPTRADLVEEIFDFAYNLWPVDDDLRCLLYRRINDSIHLPSDPSREQLIRAFERWDWRENQVKHILRHKIFEFYDFDWWYPLWDTEYMSFWSDVPAELRYDRRLHETYVEKLFAEVTGVPEADLEELYHTRNPIVSTIEDLIGSTPLEPFAQQIYDQFISPMGYEDNPMFGIMSREQFESMQTTKQNIHSYRVLDVLEEVSFEPRDESGFPKEGTVDLDWIRSRER